MAVLTRLKQILIRQAGAGAFVAADVRQVSEASLTPVAGEQVSRELEQAYMGSQEQLIVNQHQQCSFGMEFAATGDLPASQNDATDFPVWHLALLACGFNFAVVGDTSITYKPISSAHSKCKIGYRMDRRLHTLDGAMGNMNLEIAANAIPRFQFEFTGEWENPVNNQVPLAGNFAGYPVPQIGNQMNTPVVTMDGDATLEVSRFSLNMGNTVIHRSLINAEPEVLITDRAPTAEMVFDDARTATWFTEAVNNAVGGRLILAVTHGKAGGRQISVNLPRCRINPGINYSDDNGVSQITVPLQVLPGDAGNDEVSIAVT